MKIFNRIRARHWAWVFVLAIIGIWWPAFIISAPPEFLQIVVDPGILNFCMIVALVGTIIKISGYLGSQMPGKAGVIGVSVELAGLILASVGPVSYLIISVYSFAQPHVELSFGSAFIFACALCGVYLYRAIVIVPRFIFEAHDSAKDDL
jgi:hypothetical protein